MAGAAAHVQLRVAERVAPGEQAALLERDQVVPRPDLAAVRVAGQLHVDAVPGRGADLARLVGEEDQRTRGVAAGERGGEVGAVVARVGAGAVIVDAGQVEGAEG